MNPSRRRPTPRRRELTEMALPDDLMLATEPAGDPVKWLQEHAKDWIATPKVDGIRAIVINNRIRTRRGLDITARFPEIQVPPGWVLDTELAVVNPDGHANVELTTRRALGPHRGGGPAKLHVFDVLATPSHGDVRDRPYAERMRLASKYIPLLGATEDSLLMYHQSRLYQQEGVVVRRLDAPYVAGRTSTVVKIKHRRTTEAVVIGRTKGKGPRQHTFGALKLAIVKDGAVVPVGEVGSGFSDEALEQCYVLALSGRPYVVEVEHQGWTSTGKLRHAVFRRIRFDKDPTECTGAVA